MLFSRLLIPTLKEEPADAEIASHKLMVRAGLIRQVARGIYDFLPLGLRSVRKVSAIVREELDRAGCQEVLLPTVCPAELWQESGRWNHYGKELLRIKDRHDREFCLGPTHEEVMVDLVRRDVRSYRELPLNLYQIQTKFRDEIRPRFGLMRGREFLMKDGYSFHADLEDCQREYQVMHETYSRIFKRCGLQFRAVEADTGNIGGSLSHEFQVLAEAGEDSIASCETCDYAANVEKAEVRSVSAPDSDAAAEEVQIKEVSTPDVRTIEEVSDFLKVGPERFVKTLIFMADEQPVVGLVRGDDQLSEPKLKALVGCTELRMADDAEIEGLTGAPTGFAGPVGLDVRIVCDARLDGCQDMVTGANKRDAHLIGVAHRRDFSGVELADIRAATAGDSCGRCDQGTFTMHRGIEVGHIFYLGKKYSEALSCSFLDADGKDQTMEMGTYGIGVTRTVAAAIEQNHDEHGICWPVSIAPFEVILVPVKWGDEASKEASHRLHDELTERGIDVLLDDRDERAGVKFNDADLLGIPYRVTIGPRGLKDGTVEWKARTSEEASNLSLQDAVDTIANEVIAARTAG